MDMVTRVIKAIGSSDDEEMEIVVRRVKAQPDPAVVPTADRTDIDEAMKAKLAASEARGDVAPSSPTAYSLPRRGR